MENLMFEASLQRCRYVEESTTFLEMFCYSDHSLDTVEEDDLTPDEFEDFLHRNGRFAPRSLPGSVSVLAGLRLILQKDAEHPDTFAPHVITLRPEMYSKMVHTLHLPTRVIESTSCVGPFFCAANDQDDENPHLQVMQRKSHVRKKGKPRGWELMLSHDFRTGVTAGFCKGIPSSDMTESISRLKLCGLEICHPLLLPMIIFSYGVSFKTDIQQRHARDWLRKFEDVVAIGVEFIEKESYPNKRGVVDLDAVRRDLVKCNSQVLWKRPVTYLRITDGFKEAMDLFYDNLPEGRIDSKMKKIQESMLSRLEFYRKKWEGIEAYASTTLDRLEIQQSSLYNIIAQKESRLNFEMALEQKKLAIASKRDSSTMKTISLLGSIFLPGAYLASIFSTTFFNFENASDIASAISPNFWLYWAVAIPLTIIVVGIWMMWNKRVQAEYDRQYLDLEKDSEDMEKNVMVATRKKTKS